MKVCIFASGSSGNCLLVSDNGTNLLIDAGISMRRIDSALANEGLSIDDIDAVLITHEHSDHVSALKQMLKKHKVLLLAPHTVRNRVCSMLPEAEDCFKVIAVEESFTLGNLEIKPFHVSHDTDECVGYRLEGEGVFAIATDTGCVTDGMAEGLCGADTVVIESNHDENMLRYGPYPFSLKRRVLSDRGHLSNAVCAQFARYLAENGTKTIILGHISKTNNTPRLAYECSMSALEDLDVRLFCAPEFGRLEVAVEERVLCSQ